MRRFVVVVVGRDCEPQVDACLSSIADQRLPDGWGMDVQIVVDDVRCDDHATEYAVEGFLHNDPRPLGDHAWSRGNNGRRGAMRNQWDAWHQAAPVDGDVVVWVDLDDRLAHPDALAHVAAVYESGALVTYGSYIPDPGSSTCPPARPYPAEVAEKRAFREWVREGRGIWHNHLRTVSWDVLRHVDEVDCRDDAGVWWMTGPDMAVMLPALELAGDRAVFLSEVLYVYTSDLESAEWRAANGLVRRNHQQMFARPPKVRALPLTKPRSRSERRSPSRAVRPGPADRQPKPPSTMTRQQAMARRAAARKAREARRR